MRKTKSSICTPISIMCRCDNSSKGRSNKNNSIGDNVDIDSIENREDRRMSVVDVVSPSASPSPSPSAEVGEGTTVTTETRTNAAHEPCAESKAQVEAEIETETILPNVVWLEHILPCLDRPSWNALMEASKELYKLATISRLTAEYNNLGPAVAQPPWPTNLSFQSKSGGQGRAIESVTISHDGEFMACGSVIGSIEIWNLRNGKLLRWNKSHSLGNCNEEARPDYYGNARTPSGFMERRSAPIGSVLRFSPDDYTLACGFENRVFVWDLGEELFQQKNRHIGNHCHHVPSSSSSSLCGSDSYAFPPQPQLRDDSFEQSMEHSPRHPNLLLSGYKHGILDSASPAHKMHACTSRRKQECEEEQVRKDSYQTLQIECRQGTIYEVTYLGFSKSCGNAQASNRLIARYGKIAYIWTKTPVTSNATGNRKSDGSCGRSSLTSGGLYVMTHRIALSSSRCQMISNSSLTFLAVATNGSGSTAVSRRNGDVSAANNAVDGKGIIYVWDLADSICKRNRNKPDRKLRGSISTVTSSCSTKVVAYPNHVVRGLEFLQIGGHTAATATTDMVLVSASLQGEVKFWKKHLPKQIHPRDRYNRTGYISEEEDCEDESDPIGNNADDERQPRYVCVYQFQSPGKIFSLASWSSVFGNGVDSERSGGKILLAAGEARGQVRVWKVSPLSLSSSTSSSLPSSKVSVEYRGKSGRFSGGRHGGCSGNNKDKQQRLEECLSTKVGDHVHYDNIKLLAFTPNGRSLAVSRAYDAKIWFQTVWQ